MCLLADYWSVHVASLTYTYRLYCLTKSLKLYAYYALHIWFQFTEEKLGQAEKTELDAHFENLLQRAENTRTYTEKMLENTKAVLQPNPS